MRRPRAPPFIDPPGYARHRPEATLLYQLVEQHYPGFRELRAEAGRPLRRAGLTRATGATGAVTPVRRFGSALNLNLHFHLLLLDGAYRTEGVGAPVFRPVSEPRAQEPQALVERDMENAWLAGDGETDPLDDLIGHSISGFSLHAGVAIAASEREKLERLCRYVSRPPVAEERLALTPTGHVRYTLKTP